MARTVYYVQFSNNDPDKATSVKISNVAHGPDGLNHFAEEFVVDEPVFVAHVAFKKTETPLPSYWWIKYFWRNPSTGRNEVCVTEHRDGSGCQSAFRPNLLVKMNAMERLAAEFGG